MSTFIDNDGSFLSKKVTTLAYYVFAPSEVKQATGKHVKRERKKTYHCVETLKIPKAAAENMIEIWMKKYQIARKYKINNMIRSKRHLVVGDEIGHASHFVQRLKMD